MLKTKISDESKVQVVRNGYKSLGQMEGKTVPKDTMKRLSPNNNEPLVKAPRIPRFTPVYSIRTI